MTYLVFRRLFMSYSRPPKVMKILSAINKDLTSKLYESCHINLLMFLCANAKFSSTFVEDIKQNTALSSSTWDLSILETILVLGSLIF
jgi:hypothetical protein